ncbi:MAG TPA: Do family serine endopeptidase [Kofleriaceae bacterium]|nr:Do family serine endopeptidase [Kofleriaceae bacterium]
MSATLTATLTRAPTPPRASALAPWLARAVRLALAAGMSAALLTGCTSASTPAPSPGVVPAPAPAPAAAHPPASATVSSGLPEEGFAPVVARARPAIVTIFVRKQIDARRSGMPPSMFQFGPDQGLSPGDRGGGFAPEESGEGSGVILSPDGTILTNRHVVDGADSVEVLLTDGRKLIGKVVGVDSATDIAVVKVGASGLPTVPIGDSGALQVGDFTLAIGSPFGLGQSVTFGIVSAVGRSGIGLADYEDFIQTDAAINPGNSGGALLDTHGRLIGINTAIIAHGSGGSQGIGLAVPVNLAVSVMRQLVAHGRVVRGFLGIGIQDVTPELATGLGLDRPGGALVGDVSPDSPAGKAGVKRGDVVVQLDDQPVTDGHALRVRIADRKPGTTVRLKVLRDRQPRDLSVVLGELPDQSGQADQRDERGDRGEGPRGYGMRLTDLTPRIAGEIGLASGTAGVVVAGIEANSPAAELGLRTGDVIQEIDGRAVTGAAAAAQALRATAKDAPHVLLILREGHTFYVPLARRARLTP